MKTLKMLVTLVVFIAMTLLANTASAQITLRVQDGYQPLSTDYDAVGIELSYYHAGEFNNGYIRTVASTWGCEAPYTRADAGGFVYLLVVCDKYSAATNLYEILPAGRYNLSVYANGYQVERRVIKYDGNQLDLGIIQMKKSPVLLYNNVSSIAKIPTTGGSFGASLKLVNNNNTGDTMRVKLHATVVGPAQNSYYVPYVLDTLTIDLEAFQTFEYTSPMAIIRANLPDGGYSCIDISVTDAVNSTMVWGWTSTCATKGTPREFHTVETVKTAAPPVPTTNGCTSSPTFVSLGTNCS